MHTNLDGPAFFVFALPGLDPVAVLIAALVGCFFELFLLIVHSLMVPCVGGERVLSRSLVNDASLADIVDRLVLKVPFKELGMILD